MSKKLILEVNDQALPNQGILAGGRVLMTPPLSNEYWYWRVKVGRRQSILGFPKFGTIGIGFAKESDWNTNLPFTCSADEIFGHIADNKGNDLISDEDCIAAIEMVREAARQFKGLDDEEWASEQARMAARS